MSRKARRVAQAAAPLHFVPQPRQNLCGLLQLHAVILFCELAVRTAKFVARKQWVVAGADDMYIRVYNHNTMEKVKQFEAHTDYIRWAAACAPWSSCRLSGKTCRCSRWSCNSTPVSWVLLWSSSMHGLDALHAEP